MEAEATARVVAESTAKAEATARVIVERTVQAEATQRANAEATAEAKTGTFRLRKLVEQAYEVLDGAEDPSGSLTLMLAREAVLSDWDADSSTRFSADALLRRAVDAAPPWRMTLPHSFLVLSVAFSPDGQTIVTAGDGQIARLAQLNLLAPLVVLDPAGHPLFFHHWRMDEFLSFAIGEAVINVNVDHNATFTAVYYQSENIYLPVIQR